MIESFRGGASGFIAYSDWACEALSRKYDKPVYPAYNSSVTRADIIDVPKQAPARACQDSPLLLIFIGRLLPQKKVDVLVSAVARSGDIELDVVGSGPSMTELVDQAKRLNVASRIRFHGSVYDDERKKALMDAADVAVLPGLGGLFIQEAYARGLPVICGPADGTEQDLVKSINPEFYLEEVTVQGLLDRFARLSSHRESLHSAALAANQIVRHKYNLENMVDGWTAAALSHLPRAT